MPHTPLSDEDKALFRQSVSDVKPLISHQHVEKKAPPAAPTRSLRHSDLTSLRQAAPLYLSDSIQNTVSGEASLFYARTPLEKNHLYRLKQGLLPIEGILDLHGFFAEQAKVALIQFIEHHSRLKHRLLLMIHGKGNHGQIPLLKNLVNHWLPQCPQVLAFVSAKSKDGGTGALYVLLKR